MLPRLALLAVSLWLLVGRAADTSTVSGLSEDPVEIEYVAQDSSLSTSAPIDEEPIPASSVDEYEGRVSAEESWLGRVLDSTAAALEDEEHDITDILHYSLVNKAILFVVMFLSGRKFLVSVRTHFRFQAAWHLTLIYCSSPIILYGFLYYLFSRVIAEISALGMLLGIVSLLQAVSDTTPLKRIRLIVKESSGVIRCSLWFDHDQVTVLEVRERIAQELDVSPSARINIESGKGQFIEDLQRPILPMLKNTYVSTDVFAAPTASVIITISDLVECKEVETKEKAVSFFDIMHSTEPIKYEADLYMSARVKSTAFDLVAFSISTCNGFAAASPHRQLVMSLAGSTLRFLPYIPLSGGDSASSISAKVERKVNSPFSLKGSKSVVRDKDQVVIECEGKYLSVAKGWWLAWSSDVPRRSGAFTIEITERARKNIAFNSLKSGMKMIKDTILDSKFGKKELSTTSVQSDPDDNILRAGDSFRLRNVKFSEYELGVTSVKIKDNYCYLGMRKVMSEGIIVFCKHLYSSRSMMHLQRVTSGRLE